MDEPYAKLRRLLAPRIGFMKSSYWIPFWIFFAYTAWLASPYLAYYIVGVPDLGQVPEMTGDVRRELVGTYTRFGYKPGRTEIYTIDGSRHTIHCGFIMYPSDCHVFLGLAPFNETTVKQHWYFGVLDAKTSGGHSSLEVFNTPELIQNSYLHDSLSKKAWPWLLTWFGLLGFWVVSVVRAGISSKEFKPEERHAKH